MAKTEDKAVTTAQARYSSLETERSFFLDMARQVARVTIPSMYAEQMGTEQDYQSVGAQCVNNLAAKLMMATFPPGGSFFRLVLDDFVADELAQGNDPGVVKGELEAALQKVERVVQKRLDQSGFRSPISNLFKHLIVSGNGLLQVLSSGKIKFHSLKNYVVKRDLDGNMLEGIVKETMAWDSLDEKVRAQIPETIEKEIKTGDVDVYTRWHLEKNRWKVYTEIHGVKIDGTSGSYPKEKVPFLPQRFIVVEGEDYGRGYAEEFLGDLKSYDSLCCSLIELAAVASKIVFFVDENGLTSKRKLEQAPHGGIIDGRAIDVTTLQLDKMADFQVVQSQSTAIEQRLQKAFLMFNQRQGERVTAEEIRVAANELEQTLGGIYSVLTQELQLPLVTIYMGQLTRASKLPTLPKDTVAPTIVTGLAGLGRNTELQQIQSLLGMLGLLGPEALAYVNMGGMIKRMVTSLGTDPDGLIRSENDVKKAQAAASQQALAEKAMGPAINASATQLTA